MPGAAARTAAGVLIVVLAGVAFWIWRPGHRGATRDFPDGIHMLCTSEPCGAAFDTTLAEIARFRAEDDDAPVPCPECGGPSVRASVCPSCKGRYPYGGAARAESGAPACPLCKQELPRLAPGG